MARKRHTGGLSFDDELGLWLGLRRGALPTRVPDVDQPRLRALWRRYGDQVPGYGAGRRPWGWWVFQAREAPPVAGVAEVRRLLELGQLDALEAAELLRRGDEHVRAGHVDAPHVAIAAVVRPAFGWWRSPPVSNRKETKA